MRASEKLKLHYEEIMTLKEKHNLKDLAIFGSVARGEDTESSDVDFIIVPDPNNVYSLYNFAADAGKVLGFACNVLDFSDEGNKRLDIYNNAVNDRAEMITFSEVNRVGKL